MKQLTKKATVVIGVAIILSLMLTTISVIISFPYLKHPHGTYAVKICADFSYDPGSSETGNCAKYEVVHIIKGTENIGSVYDSNIGSKCEDHGGTPAVYQQGGVVGPRFVGCAK
ncbi:hypothetical protein FWF48_03695 [Candidatus Saccharibacteria bacterium]|nr:hypothetical protein [Candidatus Saccharibacteria bacterium]